MPVVPERCPAQDGVVGEPGVQMGRPQDGHWARPASGQVCSGIQGPPAASRTAGAGLQLCLMILTLPTWCVNPV